MSRIRGTMGQMVIAGVTCNGTALQQPELSLLTRIGKDSFAVPVGKIPPEGQGKPAIVWELRSTDTLKFSVPRGSRQANKPRAAKAEPVATPAPAEKVIDVSGNQGQAEKPKRTRRSSKGNTAQAANLNSTPGRRPRTVDLTGGSAVAL